MTHPELKFWHNGAPNHLALRGGRAFDTWAADGWPVEQTTQVRHPIRNPTWALLSCPSNPDLAEQVAAIAKCPDCCVAVDVAFPITALDHVYGQVNEDGVDVGLAHWSDPANRAAGFRAIEAADVVTVPTAAWPGYPDFLDDMRVFNPNTIVLPDLDDTDESVAAFMSTLMGAWRDAVAVKRLDRTLAHG